MGSLSLSICNLTNVCFRKYLSVLLSHLFFIAPNVKIWNLTVDANNDYANVSWKHNFSVDSSEFVLEFTLDSKSQMHLSRAYKGTLDFTGPAGDPNHPLVMFNWASFIWQIYRTSQ